MKQRWTKSQFDRHEASRVLIFDCGIPWMQNRAGKPPGPGNALGTKECDRQNPFSSRLQFPLCAPYPSPISSILFPRPLSFLEKVPTSEKDIASRRWPTLRKRNTVTGYGILFGKRDSNVQEDLWPRLRMYLDGRVHCDKNYKQNLHYKWNINHIKNVKSLLTLLTLLSGSKFCSVYLKLESLVTQFVVLLD